MTDVFSLKTSQPRVISVHSYYLTSSLDLAFCKLNEPHSTYSFLDFMYFTHHLPQIFFCIFRFGGSSCEIPSENCSFCALFASRASQFFRFHFLFWFSRMELPFPEIRSFCFPEFFRELLGNLSWMASFSSLKYREMKNELFCLRVILR